MAGPQKVGDYYVEYSSKGLEELARGMAGVGEGLGELARKTARVADSLGDLAKRWKDASLPVGEFTRAGRAAGDEYARLGEKVARIFAPLGATFGQQLQLGLIATTRATQGATQAISGMVRLVAPAAAALTGWATAGVMASSAGQVLSIQFAELSRQIGSLFMPQVRMLLRGMQDLVRWFQGLTGAQQAGLRAWALMLAGFAAAAVALPIIVGGFKALVAVIAGLKVVLAGLNLLMMTNPVLLAVGAIAAAAVLAAAGIAALVVATIGWEETLKLAASVGQGMVGMFQDIADAIRDAVGLMQELIALMPRTPFGLSDAFRSMKRATTEGDPDRTSTVSWMTRLGFHVAHQGVRAQMGLPYEKMKEREYGRDELSPRLTGFEDVTNTYKRIAEMSRLVGGPDQAKTAQEEALEQLKEINGSISEIKQWRIPLVK